MDHQEATQVQLQAEQQASMEMQACHEEAMAQQWQALSQAIATKQENTHLLDTQQETTEAQMAALQESVQCTPSNQLVVSCDHVAPVVDGLQKKEGPIRKNLLLCR